MKNNPKNNSKNNPNMKKLALLVTAAIAIVVIVLSSKLFSKTDSEAVGTSDIANTTETTGTAASTDTTDATKNQIPVVKDDDLVIQVKDITDTATFYPAEINGTTLEVLAVKAPDGSIRTAFNTCQVCYSSGKGYYKQEGDELVCQNCGNRFGMDDVQVTKGGCNPVPITSEYKTVKDDTITISKDVLTQASAIFADWKK